jgi:hypothetical protein
MWTVLITRTRDRGFESHPRHGRLCAFILCVGRGLATGSSPVQGFIQTVHMITKLQKAARAQQSAVEPLLKE